MEKKKSLRHFMGQEKVAGYVFSLPFIIGFALFLMIPMVLSLYYSFCKYDIQNAPTFVGLRNYVNIFQDEVFWKALKVTCYYALIGTPLKVIFALIIALILCRDTKATGLYRATYYLPSIIGGSVAIAILWRRMFESTGIINAFLSLFFPGMSNFNWFSESSAIWVLIILTVWQFGSSMLIFLSALKQINKELYEAAMVDGANKWKQFWRITLPLLTPTIFFNLVQQTINSFLAFTQSKLITNGDPKNSTLFYTLYVYNKAFPTQGKSQMGYASALAWIMLIIVSTVTALLFLSRNKWVYED
ncbi:carbohydrate ABC transporter permease [Butyrivibrio proteoclasticus]|uniref:carbohydrate ABC transporter permease n=1 Tax=Butyrivibrio proteoclasticus TaxID=43305 RepID=UPI00047D52A8|nr:sugar ABC transporter permease [Butyrivibrio proteoclasticus]